MPKSLTGSIALTKLKHIRMKGKGKNGPIEGIFIPIEANKLIEGKVDSEGNIAVYMNVSIYYKEEADQYGNNGLISKVVSGDDFKAAKTDEEKAALKEFTPILGNIKEWTKGGSTADNSGAVSNDTFDPDDDLPF